MPFVPDNQLYPDQARYDELKTFLTAFRNEWSTAMATLNEDLTRYFGDVDTQFQQIRDGLQTQIDALTQSNADKDAVIAGLQGLQTEVASAQTRLGEKQSELEADDPAPEPDPQPAGDEPA